MRLACLIFCAALLSAHPMGNFSISHYSNLQPGPGGVDIHYVLDFAEIPTFELLREWGLEAASPRASLNRKALEQARKWVENLRIVAAGKPVRPVIRRVEVSTADGAGNMPVMRVSTWLHVNAAPGRFQYEDENYPERAGWKEIVAAAVRGAGIRAASHDGTDRSHALTNYPQDPTVAPPQDLRAELEWTADRPVRPVRPDVAAAPPPPPPEAREAPRPPGTPSSAGAVVRGDYLSRLLGNREITFSMIFLGALVAFGLGAMHALSPGHGKTIVAAYLVGSRGTPKHAAFLGAMVTATHTISVFALGLTTLFLAQYVVPEKIYPVLGAISGLSIVVIGCSLLFKRIGKLMGRSEGHHHHHGPGGHSHVPEGEVSVASLIALGASGGLVPCPSALVLLLSSIALGRVGLGLILLVGFSLGLAVVLMAIGMLVLFARHLLPDPAKASRHSAFRLVPVLSAAVIVCVGLLMTGVSLGWVRPEKFLG